MNYDAIVNIVCEDQRYKNYCMSLTKGNDIHKDLYQEFIFTFLSQERDKIIDMFSKPKNVFDFWSVKVIKNMYINKYSKFKKSYYNSNAELSGNEAAENDYDHSIDCYIDYIEHTDAEFATGAYNRMLSKVFRLYVNYGSYRKVSLELSTDNLSISHTTVKKFCDEYKDLIKNNINLCNC